LNDLELMTICERIERDQWADACAAAPPGLTEAGDVALARFAGAVAGRAPGIDVLAANRVVGLGMFEPATPGAVDACVDFFRRAEVPRFFVQLCPAARPPDLAGWLTARGLRHHNNWQRLYRATAGAPDAPPGGVRVAPIDRTAADVAAGIVGAAFGFPPPLVTWFAELVGRPGWRHYLAFDGDQPVATAGMFVSGDAAWLGWAATASDARGRGAQTALIVRRIADAAAAGCRHLVVETAEDTPEKPNPSTRNLHRLGFADLYLRPNYIWTREPPA
jgi:hypothetical protein